MGQQSAAPMDGGGMGSPLFQNVNSEGGVVQYLQLPTLAQAQEALMRAKQQGYNGYIDPYGNDRNGHEVRIWQDPNLPSLGPAPRR